MYDFYNSLNDRHFKKEFSPLLCSAADQKGFGQPQAGWDMTRTGDKNGIKCYHSHFASQDWGRKSPYPFPVVH